MAPMAAPGRWGGVQYAYCFNDQQTNQVFKKHAILFRIGPKKKRERKKDIQIQTVANRVQLWFSMGISCCTVLEAFTTAILYAASQWAWSPFKSIFLEGRKGHRPQAQQARAILNYFQ